MESFKNYFVSKKVTEQYPENRATLKVADRFRGELKLVYENGEHKCVACGICQMNCPNGTIQVIANKVTTEDGKTKRVLDKYMYDLGSNNYIFRTNGNDASYFAGRHIPPFCFICNSRVIFPT